LELLFSVRIGVPLLGGKAQLAAHGSEAAGTDVAGHDDDGVLEVHRPALRVGDPAVIQKLQQDVPHILVGLFDLVKQYHGVGLAPHLLR
ncbi:DUF4179 domain-containing protein, partial [Dysosmobacter welbionis]